MNPHTPIAEPIYHIPSGLYGGSVLYNKNYQGPRTTKAASTVAAHIQSFYQLFVIIVIILVMIIIGIAAIIVGVNKKDACPLYYDATTWLLVFGISDLIICFFITLLVCKLIFTQSLLIESAHT
jgi:hypothetical protein